MGECIGLDAPPTSRINRILLSPYSPQVDVADAAVYSDADWGIQLDRCAVVEVSSYTCCDNISAFQSYSVEIPYSPNSVFLGLLPQEYI